MQRGAQGGDPRRRARDAFPAGDEELPKEMLPVVDRPAIQYVVEEAVQAGLTDILIITGRNKRAVEDHFDRNFELEHYLETTGKHDMLKEVQFASDLADIHYVRQRDPLGLGHAVSVARHHVGDEPFAVLLADDIMVDDARVAALDARRVRALRVARCVAVQEVSPEEISSYGCVEPDGADAADGVVEIRRIVEKPRARGSAVEPRGHRPLRVHARRSSTRSIASSPARAASSSSPTRSRCCSARRACSGCAATAVATTSARSSTSCGPTSSSRSTGRISVPRSPNGSASSCSRRGLA